MLRNRSCGENNRSSEFYKEIAGKYRVSVNSFSVLPRLIYLETGRMLLNITNNCFLLNGKPGLQVFNFEKYINYSANNYITKSGTDSNIIRSSSETASTKRSRGKEDHKANIYLNSHTGTDSNIILSSGETASTKRNRGKEDYKANIYLNSHTVRDNKNIYRTNGGISRLLPGKWSDKNNTNTRITYAENIINSYGNTDLINKGTDKGVAYAEVSNFIYINRIMRQLLTERMNLLQTVNRSRTLSNEPDGTIAAKIPALNNAGLPVRKANILHVLTGIDIDRTGSLAAELKVKALNLNGNSDKKLLSGKSLISVGHMYTADDKADKSINDLRNQTGKKNGTGSSNSMNRYAENVYSPVSQNKANIYSTDGNGINTKTGNIKSLSPSMELARREPVSAVNQKIEAASQNVRSEGTKGTDVHAQLDINMIVNRVYNELERKIRIEKERQGF